MKAKGLWEADIVVQKCILNLNRGSGGGGDAVWMDLRDLGDKFEMIFFFRKEGCERIV